MVTAIEGMEIQGYAYTYDQLQRLTKMEAFRDPNLIANNNWSTSAPTTDYFTQISYDKNGNITNLLRNGIQSTATPMDSINYHYGTVGGNLSNRLDYVSDLALDNSTYSDIKQGQATGNYTYNKIGELTVDASEDMTLVWRTGDHKLRYINRTDANSPNIEFIYNPLGVRVAKIEKPRSSYTLSSPNHWKTTYYTYDANGQLMATYTSSLDANPNKTTTLDEQYIYGSKRIGVIKANLTVYDNGIPPNPQLDTYNNELGKKRYELTNHLGNVMVTVSDRKVYNSTDQVYEPVITMKADYYPFGMLMPGRFEGVDEARHLFNGMEADGEVSGNGNSYTTQFRQYDPRLGRWKSLDPLMKDFPHLSPFIGMDNNPIYFTDPFGLAPFGGGDDGIKVRYFNMVKDEDGNYKPVEQWSSTVLQVKTTAELVSFGKRDGNVIYPGTYYPMGYVGVYTYWNEDGTIKRQVVRSNTHVYNFYDGKGSSTYGEVGNDPNNDDLKNKIVAIEMTSNKDYTGFIQNARDYDYEQNYGKAVLKDLTANIWNGFYPPIDDALVTTMDDNSSVGDIVMAWVPVVLTTRGGKVKVGGRMGPTKLKVGDQINIKKFKKVKNKRGYSLEKERATNTGSGGHGAHHHPDGGSAYKLKKDGKNVFSLDKNGKIIKKY